MKPKIEGIIPPSITSFTPEGTVDEYALKNVFRFQIEHGVKGLFVCGTYGSGPIMDVEQRKAVAEIATNVAKKRVSVIVHVGAINTMTSVELAKHAADMGVSAISSVPPYYYSFDEAAVMEHYKQLVKSVNIPVFVYNNPSRTGFKISSDFLARLADMGIAGVKDSSFDIVVFYEYLMSVTKPDFVFIIGTEALCLPALMMGADACISGLANAFPELVVDLYDAVKRGDLGKARDLQLKVLKARKALHIGPTISSCHEALRLRGIEAGMPKRPIRPLTEKERDDVRKGLAALGLIKT